MMRSKTRRALAGFTALVVLGVAWATPGSGLATTATANPSASNPAGALQLDAPEAPSHARVGHFRILGIYGGTFGYLGWWDNSTDEEGFTVEVGWRNESGTWVLERSIDTAGDDNAAGLEGRPGPDYRFRVKAVSASGDSAWSNWAH